MSAHSPGPWKADKNDAEPFYRVVDATGDLVARVRAQWTNGDVNALLIAAAPEMLALLRRLQREGTVCGDGGPYAACAVCHATDGACAPECELDALLRPFGGDAG